MPGDMARCEEFRGMHLVAGVLWMHLVAGVLRVHLVVGSFVSASRCEEFLGMLPDARNSWKAGCLEG